MLKPVYAKFFESDHRDRILCTISTIPIISENIEKFHFNKCVASIYEYLNELNKLMDQKNISEKDIIKVLNNLCIILQPFTPHLSEEIWEMLGNEGFCANASWPELINVKVSPYFNDK